MFEPNVPKLVIIIFYINSSLFALLIINVKIFINLQKKWCTFDQEKNDVLKKLRIIHSQGLNVLNMQKHFLFVPRFKHVNFTIMKNIPKKFMTIQTIMIPLWSFKHMKM